MAKSQLSDEELLAAISAAEAVAIGATQGDIASDRADAIDRYLGRAYGDEQPGRSSVVSRDVADVVEGVLANVIKPFVSGDQLVQFDPISEEDEEQAKQETDYINYVVLERNNGFLCLTSACKDALLLRNGYLKANWKKRSDIIIETYTGQSDEEVALLLQDKDVELVGHREYPDPMSQGALDQMGQPAATMLHDVRLRRARPTEYVEVMPIPPDEVLVSDRATGPSLQDVDFVQHRVHVSLSDVRQMGYKVDDDIGDDDDSFEVESDSRDRFASAYGEEDPTQDPARRIVLFKETWLRIDRDGDGIAELRRVCQVGQKLLADEEADIVPIACGTGTVMPHEHLGVSAYDMVADLARLKTALMRSFMDAKYLSTAPRMVVNVDSVNVDDLLISRPGGIIRTTGVPGNDVFPLLTPDTGASALQGLEYLDSVRENRTGYTRYAQGMDSDSLINKTATGLMQATSQSQLRLEMISRTIAETLLRDLFRIVHALTLKHSTKDEKVRLRNKWVTISPRSWVKRTDLQISVGLGSGTGDQVLQKLMALNPLFQQAMQMGLAGQQEAYNYAAEVLKAAGFKNPDRFVKAPQPGAPPPPQQPNPLLQVEELKQKSLHALKDKEFQFEAQKGQQEVQAKAGLEQQRMQNEIAAQNAQAQADMAVEQYKIDKQAELERYKADLDAQTRLQIADMQIRSNAAIASQRQIDGNPNNGEMRQ
jgi:hypothetical protein